MTAETDERALILEALDLLAQAGRTREALEFLDHHPEIFPQAVAR